MTNFRISTGAQNNLADALDAAVNLGSAAGTIKIYSGTQPADANTGLSGNTLLATFTLDVPAFGTASGGAVALGGTPRTVTGAAAGTATWARCATGGTGGIGTVFDCDVGTSSATLILNTVTISVGVNLSLSSGSVTMPAG